MTIKDNGNLDVDLRFGSGVILNEVVFDKLKCDDTVLSRDGNGDPICPR